MSTSIKVSELFYSIQGEGRYTGVPSVFLRTFGCNFRCKNFGRDPAEIINGPNPEVADVIKNISNYNSLDGLPLVHTGCDSYAAIYPEFKHLSPLFDTQSLAKKIIQLLPDHKWKDEHLVITGGEPLLGWQRSYPALLSCDDMHPLKEITFETNGTQKLDSAFKQYLHKWVSYTDANPLKLDREITFSVSAKLSCSGEPREKAINPDIVCEYQDVGFTYLKFVVASSTDVEEAIDTLNVYRSNGFTGPCYLMPIGGTSETFYLNNKQVAELALKYGLRFSDRLHLGLFGNAWAT